MTRDQLISELFDLLNPSHATDWPWESRFRHAAELVRCYLGQPGLSIPTKAWRRLNEALAAEPGEQGLRNLIEAGTRFLPNRPAPRKEAAR